jgi:hypothetical protein
MGHFGLKLHRRELDVLCPPNQRQATSGLSKDAPSCDSVLPGIYLAERTAVGGTDLLALEVSPVWPLRNGLALLSMSFITHSTALLYNSADTLHDFV